MRMAITGAAGELGRMTAEAAIRSTDPATLILISRDPAKLADFARRGAEVRHGDFDKPETLGPALAGAERMLLISTADVGERRRAQHQAAIRAAEGTPGLRQIAYTSSTGIHPRNPSFVIPDHRFTEELLRASPLAATILRMNSYADILVDAVAPQAIATGQWISSAGDGVVGFVAKQDCAAAAAGVLTGQGHAGAIYEITGPELLSNRDAAAIASELSGKPIAYIVPPDEPGAARSSAIDRAEDEQAAQWIGPFTIADLKSFEYAVHDGHHAIVTRHVEMITGRPALSLRALFIAHLDRLRTA
ncbi:MAG: NAD(P)H-binding protein [Sphingomonadales bacterium]|nr:NAD(P)H-binding protein [Sphingomonadales bacterium]